MKPVPRVRAVRIVTTDGSDRAAMSAGVRDRGAAGACSGGAATGAAWDAHPRSTDATIATRIRMEIPV
jgi:hypothetical protein